MKQLEPGEELTISYLDLVNNSATRQERQEYLYKHFRYFRFIYTKEKFCLF